MCGPWQTPHARRRRPIARTSSPDDVRFDGAATSVRPPLDAPPSRGPARHSPAGGIALTSSWHHAVITTRNSRSARHARSPERCAFAPRRLLRSSACRLLLPQRCRTCPTSRATPCERRMSDHCAVPMPRVGIALDSAHSPRTATVAPRRREAICKAGCTLCSSAVKLALQVASCAAHLRGGCIAAGARRGLTGRRAPFDPHAR